jgi:hypothetical protein
LAPKWDGAREQRGGRTEASFVLSFIHSFVFPPPSASARDPGSSLPDDHDAHPPRHAPTPVSKPRPSAPSVVLCPLPASRPSAAAATTLALLHPAQREPTPGSRCHARPLTPIRALVCGYPHSATPLSRELSPPRALWIMYIAFSDAYSHLGVLVLAFSQKFLSPLIAGGHTTEGRQDAVVIRVAPCTGSPSIIRDAEHRAARPTPAAPATSYLQ